LELFRRAHAQAPSPRTFGQMGLVEASLDRWVDAETHLSVSLANPDDAWVTKNRAFLNAALAVSRQHLGDLVVSGPDGAEITVGGKPVGTLPAVPALRLVEGTAVVSAEAPGFKPFEQTVTIRPGARTPLAIVLAPLPSQATSKSPPITPPPPHDPDVPPVIPPPPPDHPSVDGPSHWHPWVGAALAVVGVGAVGLGVAWISIDGTPTCGGCISVYSTKTNGIIATAAGAAAIAGGAVIFFTGPSSSSKVALSATPGSLLLSGRF